MASILAAVGALAVVGCGAPSYRQLHPNEPIAAAADGFHVDVQGLSLTEDTIESGIGDGMALAVELTVRNGTGLAYSLKPTALWCLMQVDARKPDETRLLPPSANGDGAFPGAPPEGADLTPIEVAPGQTRSFWVLFRGYRFAGSEVPRRITLTLPDAAGRALELVLADPARGDLRWQVPPTASTWTVGFQGTSLYGGYSQAMATSTRFARLFRAGRFLWDVGLVSTVLVQVKGALRSETSSFMGIGVDAHATMPLFTWGEPSSPVRLGPFLGGSIQTLIAIQPTPTQPNPPPPPAYGAGGPEAGLELDIGALRNAATPFPLTPAGTNPLPRWLVRLGYTHTWIGHGTADGYFSSVRLAW
jgi:hypothetical protein